MTSWNQHSLTNSRYSITTLLLKSCLALIYTYCKETPDPNIRNTSNGWPETMWIWTMISFNLIQKRAKDSLIHLLDSACKNFCNFSCGSFYILFLLLILPQMIRDRLDHNYFWSLICFTDSIERRKPQVSHKGPPLFRTCEFQMEETHLETT